jgi:uncharacterized protein YbjT (DUF2867 family)
VSGRTALLLGATGLVGGHCLDALVASDAYARVTVLARRATGRAHPKLDERVVDFARLADAADAFDVDEVFCCLGTTLAAAGSREAFRAVDHDLVVEAGRLAAAAGARTFLLVSATGAGAGSRVFYSRVKGEAEDALRALPLPALVLLRPSLLLGARAERRTAERVGQAVMRAAAPLFAGPLRRWRALDGAAVARAMVRTAPRAPAGVTVLENEEIARVGA